MQEVLITERLHGGYKYYIYIYNINIQLNIYIIFPTSKLKLKPSKWWETSKVKDAKSHVASTYILCGICTQLAWASFHNSYHEFDWIWWLLKPNWIGFKKSFN